jgi:hypothetical protein
MLELHITNTNLTDSNASVGWCVDRETLEMLASIGWKNPAIVIITVPVEEHATYKEYRKIVDLKDYVSYIEFRSAGPNKIFAYIVENKKYVISKDFLLKKDNGEYYRSSICGGGEDYIPLSVLNRFNIENDDFAKLVAAPLDVMVPEGVFAKPPAKWEKTWISWLNTSKSIDQCEWRKKRLFAFSVQPIIFLLAFLLRFGMYFAAFMAGMNGIKHLSFLNPLGTQFYWATRDLFDGGHWLTKRINDDTPKTLIKSLLFNIFVLVFTTPLSLALLVLMWKFHFIFGILKTLSFVLACLLFIIGGAIAITAVINTIKNRKEKRPAWYLEQENADLLVCSPDKKITSINDLPSNKKTIWLRFQDLKSKVCRPYSA